MKKLSYLCLLFSLSVFAQNELPVIENLQAQWVESENHLKVNFTIQDIDNDVVSISLYTSEETCAWQELSTMLLNVGEAQEITLEIERPTFFKVIADDLEAPDIQALVDGVQADSLEAHLSAIVGVRHFDTGLEHLENVKDWIEQRFEQACLETYRHELDSVTNEYLAENIIGRKVGITDTTIIIDGHFDTVNISPGADDNGSAVAGVIEAARILNEHCFKHNIDFIGFDLEELGLVGSTRYVAEVVDSLEEIIGVLNFEMIGYYDENPNTQTLPAGFNLLFPEAYELTVANEYRGDFITNVANEASTDLMEKYENCAADYVPTLKVISLAVPGTGSIAPDLRRSDHAKFWDAGIPALMLTDGANFRNLNYHTANDTIGTIDFEFMADVVKATIATAASLGEMRHATQETVSVTDWIDSGLPTAFPYQVQIMQNTSNRTLNIQLNQIAQVAIDCELYDLTGKQVQKQTLKQGETTLSIDVQSLQAAIYILKVSDGQFQKSHKIVIE